MVYATTTESFSSRHINNTSCTFLMLQPMKRYIICNYIIYKGQEDEWARMVAKIRVVSYFKIQLNVSEFAMATIQLEVLRKHTS